MAQAVLACDKTCVGVFYMARFVNVQVVEIVEKFISARIVLRCDSTADFSLDHTKDSLMAGSTWSRTCKRAALALLVGAGVNLALALPSMAGTAGPFSRSSQVTDSVLNNNNGTWSYGYTIHNTSSFDANGDPLAPILVDWELPWFGDAGININSILSPRNWAHSIETIGTANPNTGWEGVARWQDPSDPFYAGSNSPFTGVTQVLHWYNVCWANQRQATTSQPATSTPSAAVAVACEGQFDNAVFIGGSLAGFGFDAAFDETAAPYQASWAFLPVRTGDPAFPLGGIPNSPNARGLAVPEPAALGLLGTALLALVWSRRKRG